MKKKIQKYLAGEREGFSLVELIIVIAIMAILVGVVALAVLPNIEKSKESKDFAVLDSVCSALNAAVASTQVSGEGNFELPTSKAASPSTDADKATDADKVGNALLDNLGSGGKTLSSSNASGSKIFCNFNVSQGVIEVYVADSALTPGSDGKISDTDAGLKKCKYNDQKPLKVSN